MMISPEGYMEELREKSYRDLLSIREELLDEIRAFESRSYDPELDMIKPSPEVIYQMNLEYLGKLCELISEKYNKEYVQGEPEDYF